MAAVLMVGSAGVARFVPSSTILGPLARVLEVAAPWALLLGVLLALAAWRLGARLLGPVLAALICLNGAELLFSQRALTVPQATDRTEPNLRILFFNARETNTLPADQILAAALAEDPDILVFAEARPLLPGLADLRERFAFVSPCTEDSCELLVALRDVPERFWRLQLNPIWSERYAVIEMAPGQFVAINHVTKPWFSGVSEAELDRLGAQYRWLPDTAVVVGDFNMPLWSRPMRDLLVETGFRRARNAPATWPAGWGQFGLPIDQILLRGEAQWVSLRPFGAGLGSNHLGFVAEVLLPTG